MPTPPIRVKLLAKKMSPDRKSLKILVKTKKINIDSQILGIQIEVLLIWGMLDIVTASTLKNSIAVLTGNLNDETILLFYFREMSRIK